MTHCFWQRAQSWVFCGAFFLSSHSYAAGAGNAVPIEQPSTQHQSSAHSIERQTAEPQSYRYSDAHVHVLDFFQQGQPLTKLLEVMNAAGVGNAMVSGAPLMKKWHENEPKRPRYYAGDDAELYWYSATDAYVAEAVQKLPPADRRRLHPFLSGINPTDKNAVIHLEAMLKLYPNLWQGIGEILTRHDDLTMMTANEPPRANSEAMYRIYRFAQQHDLPVMVHTNITSKRERNPLYLEELKEALRAHPDVKFIWAHAGTSKTLERFQGKMDFVLPSLQKLLKDHDNVYVDLSWSVLKPYMLDKTGQPEAAWLELINTYPTRFMLGSDVLGSFDNLGENLQEFEVFLEKLPADTARKMARENFLALLPSTAANY